MLACDDYTASEIRLKLKKCNLDSLHLSRRKIEGKKLKRLLEIIRKEIARSNFGYFRFMISPKIVVQTTTDEIIAIASNLLKKIHKVTVSNSIKRLVAYIGVPAIEVITKIKCDHRLPLSIFIENKHGIRSASHQKMLLGLSFDEVRNHLRILLKNYLKHAYKLDCVIEDVSVVKSDVHPIINAVDSLGNLSLDYVRTILYEEIGKSVSPSMKTKHDIFADLLREIGDDLYRQQICSAFTIINNKVVPTNPEKSISVFEMWRTNIPVEGQ